MRKRKSGQPAGTDLDWFVIPIQKIRQWGIVLVLLLVAGGVGYFVYCAASGSPQDRRAGRDRRGRGAAGPRDAGRRRDAAGLQRRAGPGFPRAMPASPSRGPAGRRRSVSPSSPSPTRAARSAARARGEQGDASFIFVEGDVSLQRAGRSTFEPARQRQPLFDGDFVKAGKTGSAEIMFYDGTLYTIRPGSLFECRRPVSSEVNGSQIKIDLRRDQRLHVRRDLDGRHGLGDGRDRARLARVGRRRPWARRPRSRASAAARRCRRARRRVVLEGREKVSADADSRRSRPRWPCPTRRSRPCRRTTGSTT